MTAHKPLVLSGGVYSELKAGDELDINGLVVISPSATNSYGGVVVNYNAVSAQVVPHPSSIHISAADAQFGAYYVDTFSGLRSIINMRCAQGTGAAPAASHAGDELGRLSGRGHQGSQFTNSNSAISFFAAEAYTPTSQGGWAGIRVTPIGTAGGGSESTPPLGVAFTSSGGAVVGIGCSTPTAPNTETLLNDPGNGYLQVLAGIKLTGAAPTDTLAITVASFSGTGPYALKLPAGTTDFSGTGGPSQVVKQTSLGGPFSVSQLSQAEISGNGVSKLWPATDSTTAVQIMKANGTTPLLTIDTTNGWLGVDQSGANPAAPLHVYTTSAGFMLHCVAESTGGQAYFARYQNSASAWMLRLVRFRGTQAAQLAVNSGDPVGNIAFEAGDTAGSATSRVVAQTGAVVDTLNATNDISGYYAILTRPNGVGAALVEGVRVSKSAGTTIGNATFNAANDPGQGALAVQNGIKVAAGGIQQTTFLTVGTLPTASTTNMGTEYYVTDANGPTYGTAPVSGGSRFCKVRSIGTGYVCC